MTNFNTELSRRCAFLCVLHLHVTSPFRLQSRPASISMIRTRVCASTHVNLGFDNYFNIFFYSQLLGSENRFDGDSPGSVLCVWATHWLDIQKKLCSIFFFPRLCTHSIFMLFFFSIFYLIIIFCIITLNVVRICPFLSIIT